MNAQNKAINAANELQITGEMKPGYEQILNREAINFLTELVTRFAADVDDLLMQRVQQQKIFDQGKLPDFRDDTAHIREDQSWKVRDLPSDLLDRRVEITGPVDRKMVINGLNSGAKVYMCCFEDATAPTWQNMIDGQINLRDANLGSLSYQDPKSGRQYQLNEQTAVLIARPRGLHLPEQHIRYQGQAIPGCLMDFGLYMFHNQLARTEAGTGIYFYLPKLQTMEEALWWSQVFSFSEDYFGLPRGSIRATVLIETLTAAFQMEEILHGLRDHIAAINCGRWDYIFSYIKTLQNHSDRLLPDRAAITMATPFLEAYSLQLIRNAHKRGALAMGGMAALIPSKDEAEMESILARVVEDKEREARNGHDGTWVAHPGLVDTAMQVFDRYLADKPNQLDTLVQAPSATAGRLLTPCTGSYTEQGARTNIEVALLYIAAWVSGRGCVPIHGLMEDAATAEISRCSLWQWLKHQAVLDDGRTFEGELFNQLLEQEYQALVADTDTDTDTDSGAALAQAKTMLQQMVLSAQLEEFLTLPGYQALVAKGSQAVGDN